MAEKVGISSGMIIIEGGKRLTPAQFTAKRRNAATKAKKGSQKARSVAMRIMSDFISSRSGLKPASKSAKWENPSARPDVQGSINAFLKAFGVDLEATGMGGGSEAFLELKQATAGRQVTVTGKALTRDTAQEASFRSQFGVGERTKKVKGGKDVESFTGTQINSLSSDQLHRWLAEDKELQNSILKQAEQKFENFALIDYIDEKHGGKPVFKVLPGAAKKLNLRSNFKNSVDLTASQKRTSGGKAYIQIDVKLSKQSMRKFFDLAIDATTKFHDTLGTNFSTRFMTYAVRQFNAAGKISATDYLEAVMSFAREFEEGSNTPLIYKTVIKETQAGKMTQGAIIDLGKSKDGPIGRFISKAQMSALVQKAVIQRMPKGPKRGKPLSEEVLTYRTGRFAKSVQIAFLNYKTNVIKFFYDPIYQVHEPTRSPSELIETSIREVTQQLYGRQFNILRM